MKMGIRIDERINIPSDLGTIDNDAVKIVISGSPYSAVLQKSEEDSSPMRARDFLDYVVKCGTQGVGIVVEEDAVFGSKAWICSCDDLEDDEEVNCTIEERDGALVICPDRHER